ncbi:MAG: polymerase subunit sigma [Caulobacter sp.]|nr:polymerase subunit sigma [Caulobacter sp.]
MSRAISHGMTGRRPFFRPHLAEATAASPAPRPLASVAPPIKPSATAPDPGRRERFNQVMLPHLDGAYSLARYLARDPTAAEDIVQDAYLNAWRAFPAWRGGSARAWLFAIVRNGFLSGLPARRVVTTPPEEAEALADPDQPSPEAALLQSEAVGRVRAAIAALPDPFRETLVLRELEELSYKDIADVTGVPIGTVMSRLARARQLLSERLLAPNAENAR